MSARRAVLALLALGLAAGTARAQDRLLDLLGAANAGRGVPGTSTGMPLQIPMSGPIDPAEYVLGPGDVLSVYLGGALTRNWDITVSPEGTVYVPTVGAIPVAGTSLLEARRAVIERISRDYKGVAIDLRLTRPRIMVVNLAGETRHNGVLEVAATSRATEVLADTLFSPKSSQRNIEIRRLTAKGPVRISVDLTRFRLTGRTPHDPLLHDGDVLYVPVSTTSIGVEGAVGRPGFFDLGLDDSLSTLLDLAGGPVAEAADEAKLVRFRDATHTDTLSFKLSDVTAGRYDIALRDGDRAFLYYVPRYHQLQRATILGAVQRAGSYPLTPGTTRISDLVESAGGFLAGADLSALRVYRANRAANEADPQVGRLTQLSRKDMTTSEYAVLRAHLATLHEDFRVDWSRLKKQPDLDMVLHDGDVVSVDPIVATIRVEGEVLRPGFIRFEAGRRADAYVKLAGGFTDRASRGQVRITRAVNGQTILARDVAALEPGDLVWVPERGETAAWQNLQSILLVLAQIATVIVAVRPR